MSARRRAAHDSRLYTIAGAVVAWLGVALQCCLSLHLAAQNGHSLLDGLVIFLGYFTVLTNLLVCLALTFPLIAEHSAAGRLLAMPFAVAGIAANIAFVALGYHFLLRKVWHPQGAQLLADVLLHYVTPALFIGYWFVHSRPASLRWAYPLLWSLYPAAYFAYALVRGEIIGVYPYGFIDVSMIGYAQTAINAIALLCGFIVLGFLFVGVNRVCVRSAT